MTDNAAGNVKQGLRLDDTEAIASSIRAVVDYRGDVTITRGDGATVEGYVFDCVDPGDPTTARLRMLPKDGGAAVTVEMADVAAIDVNGRDTAEGKSFETWVRKYVEKMRAEGRM